MDSLHTLAQQLPSIAHVNHPMGTEGDDSSTIETADTPTTPEGNGADACSDTSEEGHEEEEAAAQLDAQRSEVNALPSVSYIGIIGTFPDYAEYTTASMLSEALTERFLLHGGSSNSVPEAFVDSPDWDFHEGLGRSYRNVETTDKVLGALDKHLEIYKSTVDREASWNRMFARSEVCPGHIDDSGHMRHRIVVVFGVEPNDRDVEMFAGRNADVVQVTESDTDVVTKGANCVSRPHLSEIEGLQPKFRGVVLARELASGIMSMWVDRRAGEYYGGD